MKRRDVVKTLVIIGAGAVVLPGCNNGKTSATIKLKNITITGNDEEILAALCEAIIPESANFIGAKSLNSHAFVLRMMDDCQPPEKQKFFAEGLKQLKEVTEKKIGSSFAKCNNKQQIRILKELEAGIKDENNKAAQFYSMVKAYTLQSFTSSQKFMIDIKHYKMVPGSNFKGCVKI